MNIWNKFRQTYLSIITIFRVYVRSVRKNPVAIGSEMKDPAISSKWFTMESSKFVTPIIIVDIL